MKPETCTEQSQIPDQFSRLEGLLDNYAELIEVLETRLAPALRGPSPEEALNVPNPNLCPLAQGLFDQGSRISMLNRHLGDIIDRVEL